MSRYYVPRPGRPDVAGIYAALGQRDRARTVRVARAMNAGTGRRWVSHAWPAPRRMLNGRPAPRSASRTGRTWRDQPRDGSGRWCVS